MSVLISKRAIVTIDLLSYSSGLSSLKNLFSLHIRHVLWALINTSSVPLITVKGVLSS
jgi:hypothetical protein